MRHGPVRVLYNVVAAVAMAAVLVLGGGLTAMVMVGRAAGDESKARSVGRC